MNDFLSPKRSFYYNQLVYTKPVMYYRGVVSQNEGWIMHYQVKIGKNNETPLPEALCSELGINIGDILICETMENSSKIVMTKHCNQTLSDADISAAGNLTRVISCSPNSDL